MAGMRFRPVIVAALATYLFTPAMFGLSFNSPQSVATALSPKSVALADFNGDGTLDLAVANSGSNNVSIILRGASIRESFVAVNHNPVSLAVGDFNGDGKPDLVVANQDSNNISVLLGNGDGTFQPQVLYAVENLPDSVVVGDFNNDGKLDIAVANNKSKNISILLGNGDGTFQPQTAYPASGHAAAFLVTADFNNDGKLDLAVADDNSSVCTLLGNGDGSFQKPVCHAAGSSPIAIAVADFNGDGNVDLAVAGSGLEILLGNGNGTFQPAVSYPIGSFSGTAMARFNHLPRLPCYSTSMFWRLGISMATEIWIWPPEPTTPTSCWAMVMARFKRQRFTLHQLTSLQSEILTAMEYQTWRV